MIMSRENLSVYLFQWEKAKRHLFMSLSISADSISYFLHANQPESKFLLLNRLLCMMSDAQNDTGVYEKYNMFTSDLLSHFSDNSIFIHFQDSLFVYSLYFSGVSFSFPSHFLFAYLCLHNVILICFSPTRNLIANMIISTEEQMKRQASYFTDERNR